MPDPVIPKNDIMLTSASEVNDICAPLRHLGITYFGYVRVYNDGSRFDINNNADFSEAYYYKSDCYQLFLPEMNPRDFEDGFLFASSGVIDEVEDLQEIAHTFSAGNLMVLIQKHRDYCELWNFANSPSIPDMINVYLRNMDVLKSFCFYFKDKGAHLIKRFEENRILKNKNQMIIVDHSSVLSCDTSQQARSQCLDELKIDKYYLGERYNHGYLTKREVECIKWCIRGKTAGETSDLLGITKRTVNAHLDNAKHKLNCNKQSLLIHRALDLGIFQP